MQHYASASLFLVNSLGMEPDSGTHSGTCVTCGCETETGFTLKEGFASLLKTSFTNWNRCAVLDPDGVVCGACSMMNKNHPSKIVSLYKSRLRRCLVTESGEVLMVGTDRRLKWILQNLPAEPFLLMDSRRSPAKFMHHIWMSQVSLDKQCFYYCDDFGNHLIRHSHIVDPALADKTVMEAKLCRILHDDKKIPEKPLSPDDESYN